MLYLQKMIDSVSTALGEQVLAKPAKVWCCLYQRWNDHHLPISLSLCCTPSSMLQIVAGLEPEQTNMFLQMLARAAAGPLQVTHTSTMLMQKSSQASWDVVICVTRQMLGAGGLKHSTASCPDASACICQ